MGFCFIFSMQILQQFMGCFFLLVCLVFLCMVAIKVFKRNQHTSILFRNYTDPVMMYAFTL